MTTLTSTTEAERLITEAMRLNGLLATFERDVGRKTTIEAFNLLGSLALLLRASEEARVKAERERDDLLCRIHRDGGHYISEHGIEKACQDADVIVATLNVQKDEAETALADMRRERDASDAALIEGAQFHHRNNWDSRCGVCRAIAAARSRATQAEWKARAQEADEDAPEVDHQRCMYCGVYANECRCDGGTGP